MMTPCHHKKRHSATQQKKANDSHQLQGASELAVPSSVRVLCGAQKLLITNVCGALIVLTHRALSVREDLIAVASLRSGRCPLAPFPTVDSFTVVLITDPSA